MLDNRDNEEVSRAVTPQPCCGHSPAEANNCLRDAFRIAEEKHATLLGINIHHFERVVFQLAA